MIKIPLKDTVAKFVASALKHNEIRRQKLAPEIKSESVRDDQYEYIGDKLME